MTDQGHDDREKTADRRQHIPGLPHVAPSSLECGNRRKETQNIADESPSDGSNDFLARVSGAARLRDDADEIPDQRDKTNNGKYPTQDARCRLEADNPTRLGADQKRASHLGRGHLEYDV